MSCPRHCPFSGLVFIATMSEQEVVPNMLGSIGPAVLEAHSQQLLPTTNINQTTSDTFGLTAHKEPHLCLRPVSTPTHLRARALSHHWLGQGAVQLHELKLKSFALRCANWALTQHLTSLVFGGEIVVIGVIHHEAALRAPRLRRRRRHQYDRGRPSTFSPM